MKYGIKGLQIDVIIFYFFYDLCSLFLAQSLSLARTLDRNVSFYYDYYYCYLSVFPLSFFFPLLWSILLVGIVVVFVFLVATMWAFVRMIYKLRAFDWCPLYCMLFANIPIEFPIPIPNNRSIATNKGSTIYSQLVYQVFSNEFSFSDIWNPNESIQPLKTYLLEFQFSTSLENCFRPMWKLRQRAHRNMGISFNGLHFDRWMGSWMGGVGGPSPF